MRNPSTTSFARSSSDRRLITTDGFRDLLEIGRQKRPELYDLQADKPPVLVSRDLRFGVAERVHHDGTVEVALDEQALRAAARKLKEAGVEAVAICFLYGFVRPEHEAQAARIVAEEMPGTFVSVGHQVAPEFREFERVSTAVVNAYLAPSCRATSSAWPGAFPTSASARPRTSRNPTAA